MFKSVNRLLGLVLAGSMVGMVGCMALPNGAPLVTGATGTMDLGLAGSAYTVASLTTAAQPEKPTYTSVMFVPDEIKVHYAGPLSAEEAQEAPEDIEGEEAPVIDETSTQAGAEDPIPADGWITFKVKEGFAAIDLMTLDGASQSITFGSTPLPVGKYDKIRLVAGKPGSPATQNPLDWTGVLNQGDVSGKYFLPSNRLHINQGFEIREGYKTDLKFSFDAETAMVKAGDKTILKPASVKVFADYEKIVTPSPEPSSTPAP
jgi:hypothetical protein